MRLIDADTLIDHICNTADLGGWIGEALQQIKQVAIKYIDSTPSIDIVRCGECKWFDSKGHCMRLTAEYGTYEDVRTDDFCSYGEREGE